MTLSIGNTSTFAETRDEIITDALTNLGVVSPSKSVTDARTAGLLTHAARALNRLVKSMDADGQFLWRIVRRSATLAIGTEFITIANDVLDIDEPMGIRAAGDGSDKTPVMSMSRDEWMVLRESGDFPVEVGRPVRYFLEHTQSAALTDTTPSLHFDKVADVTYTAEYAAFIRSADFVSGATTPNFPTKWISCLVYGLTAELAPAYKQPALMSSFRTMFKEEKARLLSDDTERGSLTLVPFGFRAY